MLSFAESYDPRWVAYVNGEKLEPLQLLSVINGFWINQTGILDVTIQYAPQDWFYLGSIISITTLSVCTFYFVYAWMKNKACWKRIKSLVMHKHLTS